MIIPLKIQYPIKKPHTSFIADNRCSLYLKNCYLSSNIQKNKLWDFYNIFFLHFACILTCLRFGKINCQWIKEVSQPINLKSFGFDKMEKKISKQFQVIQVMTQSQYHLQKLYKNPDHFCYNRNSNIMTFDKNRVLLDEGEDKDSPDHYINANFVQVSDRRVIATQGPLHSTINNFWRMVYKEKVTTIFMLCERTEQTKVKCDLYWPTDVQVPLEAGNLEVKLLQKQEDGKFIRLRKFLLINKVSKEERQVCQYQFLGWPDGKKPQEVAQKSLSKLLNYFIERLQKDETVLVHCSAGVGRTGTFIAMAEIKILIPKTEAISIFQIVRKLREQRWAMVYTASQYEYLYQFAERESIIFFQPEKAEIKQFDSSDSNDDCCQADENECGKKNE